MDANKINFFLHSAHVPNYYKAKAGDYLSISLPKIPLTRYTEFLRMEREQHGDVNCFVEEKSPNIGEGSLLPGRISGHAVCPGKVHFILSAKNRLSGQTVPGVEPLDIVVEVQP